MSAVIRFDAVSKWYGQVLGVREVTLAVGPGVTGLLGPNGAGKSTLLKMLSGEIAPDRGVVTLFGRPVSEAASLRRFGYAPEIEVFYEELSAREWVAAMMELGGAGRDEARARATAALERVGLGKAMDRRLGTYSKGMRQRAKLAQAVVHDPDVVLLDEPMTGLDPLARAEVGEVVRELGARGKTVLVSSHLLDEVETLTQEVVVMYQGQLLAQGNVHAIRDLIDRHPHTVELRCDRPRELAAALARCAFVDALRFPAEGALLVETRSPDACYAALPRLALEHGVALASLTSPDDNLAAVFRYLTHPGSRGGAAS